MKYSSKLLYWLGSKIAEIYRKHRLNRLYKLAKDWYRDVKGPEDDYIWLSLIVPTFNSNTDHLDSLLESVIKQDISGVELIFSDDGSTSSACLTWLKKTANRDNVSVLLNSKNQGISANSNEAVKQAIGDWIAFLDHDDKLAPQALKAIYSSLQDHPDTQFLYTDEVRFNKTRIFSIFTKPAFDPIMLSGMNYINHLSLVRRQRLLDIGLLKTELDDTQEYDLVLRYTADLADTEILHLPYPAYWWRQSDSSYSRTHLNRATTSICNSLKIHYSADGFDLHVQPALKQQLHRPVFTPKKPGKNKVWPKIGIIIPSINAPDLIGQIIPDLFERTDYPNFEIIIIDNGSDHPQTLALYEQYRQQWSNLTISTHKEPFNFARSVNRGLKVLEADHYLLLNNDIKVIDKDWLKEMVSCLAYKQVGIVGAKLLFDDDSLQHTGVIVGGASGLASHRYYKRPPHQYGSMGRLAIRNGMSCVTGAVMLISKDCLNKVGVFDEEHFAVAYNDVDYCLRAYKAGFRIVWTPFACLYHLESKTRKSDTSPEKKQRFELEKSALRALHGTEHFQDPAANPLENRNKRFRKLGAPLSKPKARHWFSHE